MYIKVMLLSNAVIEKNKLEILCGNPWIEPVLYVLTQSKRSQDE